MRHERDKTAILDSMFGYATHKKITPEQHFKNIQKIKTSKEIISLNKRQGIVVEGEQIGKTTWKS